MGWAARHKQASCPGTVAFIAGNIGRYTMSHQCFSALDAPDGTYLNSFNGHIDISVNRNIIADGFRGEWLLMIDDDQIFLPDLLTRLLRHFDDDTVDIVAPLIYKKAPPHETVIVGPLRADGRFTPFQLTNQRGLQPVYAVGTGVLLVRRRVFERVSRPWFIKIPSAIPDTFGFNSRGHDLNFCCKAQAAGCGVYVDFDLRVGHITPMVVLPARDPSGRWTATYIGECAGDQDQAISAMTKGWNHTEGGVSLAPGQVVELKSETERRDDHVANPAALNRELQSAMDDFAKRLTTVEHGAIVKVDAEETNPEGGTR